MKVWINQTNNIVWNDGSDPYNPGKIKKWMLPNEPNLRWTHFLHDGVRYKSDRHPGWPVVPGGIQLGSWIILK